MAPLLRTSSRLGPTAMIGPRTNRDRSRREGRETPSAAGAVQLTLQARARASERGSSLRSSLPVSCLAPARLWPRSSRFRRTHIGVSWRPLALIGRQGFAPRRSASFARRHMIRSRIIAQLVATRETVRFLRQIDLRASARPYARQRFILYCEHSPHPLCGRGCMHRFASAGRRSERKCMHKLE